MFLHQNHGAGGGNGSIMVGMFVFLCLASPNPFEGEFFVPVRTDSGVKLLSTIVLYIILSGCLAKPGRLRAVTTWVGYDSLHSGLEGL